jgi:hypothetical protein
MCVSSIRLRTSNHKWNQMVTEILKITSDFERIQNLGVIIQRMIATTQTRRGTQHPDWIVVEWHLKTLNRIQSDFREVEWRSWAQKWTARTFLTTFSSRLLLLLLHSVLPRISLAVHLFNIIPQMHLRLFAKPFNHIKLRQIVTCMSGYRGGVHC